jgi:Rrf2 family transcriptional regulator, nitric oxide-sensitive transcriptional repressor
VRLKWSTTIGLQILPVLSTYPDDSVVKLGEVAQRLGLSYNNLVRGVRLLRRERVIAGARGPRGGIKLVVTPSQVPLGDLILRLEEPRRTSANCLDQMVDCANAAFGASLNRYTIADLASYTSGGQIYGRVKRNRKGTHDRTTCPG